MSKKTILWIVMIVTTAAWLTAGFMMGRFAQRPVYCHSITEDSTPYDCDYDGKTNEWRPKR